MALTASVEKKYDKEFQIYFPGDLNAVLNQSINQRRQQPRDQRKGETVRNGSCGAMYASAQLEDTDLNSGGCTFWYFCSLHSQIGYQSFPEIKENDSITPLSDIYG